ncbi:hypothetical protein CIW50_07295 [Tardiphaga sp. P9-11]|nr:hypothetical protein CIW50_07295 [Tardiphaga sp. P9-11]
MDDWHGRDGKCMDCRTEVTFITPDEYYMVHDDLWLSANPTGDGKLCVGCFEVRIGRRLEPKDFIDAPVNRRFAAMSDRLKSRVVG